MSSKKRGGLSKKEYEKKYGKSSSSSSKSSKKSKSKSSKTDNELKKMLKDNDGWDAFKNLSPDQREFIKYNFSIAKSNSEKDKKLLEEALAEATAQADPYWKSFLTIAQDEIKRAYSDEQTDYAADKLELETKIKNISDDLIKNRDFYSLEQQSELSKLKQSYEQQRDAVIEDAAANGLTFSTNREKPLQQLEDYNSNVVESTTRAYQKKLTDITDESNRAIEESNRALINRTNENISNITNIGRSGEEALGSANLPALEGYTALGNISGKMYEDQTADIEARKNAIFDEKSKLSLNF